MDNDYKKHPSKGLNHLGRALNCALKTIKIRSCLFSSKIQAIFPLGSTAMSVYNHTNSFEVDVQKIIELSAQGTAYGSMTADLDPVDGERTRLAEKQEEFNVEIARAVANGASTGALFEITALLQFEIVSEDLEFASEKVEKPLVLPTHPPVIWTFPFMPQ